MTLTPAEFVDLMLAAFIIEPDYKFCHGTPWDVKRLVGVAEHRKDLVECSFKTQGLVECRFNTHQPTSVYLTVYKYGFGKINLTQHLHTLPGVKNEVLLSFIWVDSKVDEVFGRVNWANLSYLGLRSLPFLHFTKIIEARYKLLDLLEKYWDSLCLIDKDLTQHYLLAILDAIDNKIK